MSYIVAEDQFVPLFNNGNNLCLSVVMVVVKTTLGQAGKSKPALEENRQGVCISREVDRAESQFCANDADDISHVNNTGM